MTATGGSPSVEVGEAAAWLARRTGLRLDADRLDRLAQRGRGAGASGRAYRDLLQRDPVALQEVIEHVTVGESHFFREPAQFELLANVILPGLLRARAPDAPLQLWSAGCASGEEVYTLAIVLEEQGLAGRARLAGTDLSAQALDRARDARYRAWSLRGVDERRRQAYFDERPGGFELHRRFVERVTLQESNLAGDPHGVPVPPGGFDVVFCRNVLIYLTDEARARAVRRLVGALAPDGWLVTASTDPHLGSEPGLQLVVSGGAVAYRRTSASIPQGEPDPSPGGPGRAGGPTTAPPRRRAQRTRQPLVPTPAPDRAQPAPTAGVAADARGEHQRAIGLLEQGRWEEAAGAARNALYLDPGLVVAQIALGRALLVLGELGAAATAWRHAGAALERMDARATVPLSGGASAGRLAAELAVLSARQEVAP